jgi:hypothetical protein
MVIGFKSNYKNRITGIQVRLAQRFQIFERALDSRRLMLSHV